MTSVSLRYSCPPPPPHATILVDWVPEKPWWLGLHLQLQGIPGSMKYCSSKPSMSEEAYLHGSWAEQRVRGSTDECLEKAFLRPGALTSPTLGDRMMLLIFYWLLSQDGQWYWILLHHRVILVWISQAKGRQKLCRSHVIAHWGTELQRGLIEEQPWVF